MKSKPVDTGRRDMLRIGSIAVAAAAAAAMAGRALAQGAQPRLYEKDAQAQALGYRNDSTKVDKKKFATFQAGQTCSNCQQFQGKPGDAWAGCQIFPGKQVNAKGWCSAWVKKAGGAPLKG